MIHKQPAWLIVMGALVVAWIVFFLVLVLFTHHGPQDERTYFQEDEGGGYIETFECRSFPGFLAISLLPSKEVNVSPVGGTGTILESKPLMVQTVVRGRMDVFPLDDGPFPALILVDESGNVLFEKGPVLMYEVYAMLASARDGKVYSPDHKVGEAWSLAAPPPPGPPCDIIRGLAHNMKNSQRPWPEAILNGMAGYVARMEQQHKAPDASAAAQP